jgi:hypothetical protein
MVREKSLKSQLFADLVSVFSIRDWRFVTKNSLMSRNTRLLKDYCKWIAVNTIKMIEKQ